MRERAIGSIICETATTTSTESRVISDNEGKPIIETCLQDVDKKNRNERIYPKSELFPKLKADRLVELLEADSLFGEAGHPMSQNIARQQTIDPTNLSHKIHKLWTKDNQVMAQVSAADTARGDDFNRLLLSGTKPAFSLRALGTVMKTSRGAEVRGLKIITWDWVIFPSHPCAYMTKFINESAVEDLSSPDNKLFITESDRGLIIPIDNKSVLDFIKHESGNIKSVVESLEYVYTGITINENANSVTLHGEGDKITVNLESFIKDEIMNYAINLRG